MFYIIFCICLDTNKYWLSSCLHIDSESQYEALCLSVSFIISVNTPKTSLWFLCILCLVALNDTQNGYQLSQKIFWTVQQTTQNTDFSIKNRQTYKDMQIETTHGPGSVTIYRQNMCLRLNLFYVRNTLPERSPVSILIICRKSKAHNLKTCKTLKLKKTCLLLCWGTY